MDLDAALKALAPAAIPLSAQQGEKPFVGSCRYTLLPHERFEMRLLDGFVLPEAAPVSGVYVLQRWLMADDEDGNDALPERRGLYVGEAGSLATRFANYRTAASHNSLKGGVEDLKMKPPDGKGHRLKHERGVAWWMQQWLKSSEEHSVTVNVVVQAESRVDTGKWTAVPMYSSLQRRYVEAVVMATIGEPTGALDPLLNDNKVFLADLGVRQGEPEEELFVPSVAEK